MVYFQNHHCLYIYYILLIAYPSQKIEGIGLVKIIIVKL